MALPVLGFAVGFYGLTVLGRGLWAKYVVAENESESALLDKKAKYETASTDNRALITLGIGVICIAAVLLTRRK